jgi:hypothetical protein
MVINAKKESEKLLNLSTITKEILAYCDTEEALKNLKDEWSNFKDFRLAVELIDNYTIKNNSDGTFDLTKDTSATKVISNYFDKYKPGKWDDLSDDFKEDYDVILDNLRETLNNLIVQFKGKSLSYDTHNKKFVFSRKSNKSDDYRNFNCVFKGEGYENDVNTSLLVLVDLTRFSSMSNSYKTKIEFIWFKYIFGMAELEDFLKELLVQTKRDSKNKLKSFVSNIKFNGDYPAKLFNKKFVEDYIRKSVIVVGRSSGIITVEHILNTNKDEYFNGILKECLDVSKLSDQEIYNLIKNDKDSFITGYSDLPEDSKVEFVRNIIKGWGKQSRPLSNMLGKKELNDYFSRKEIFSFFKESLKEVLELIHQCNGEEYKGVYYLKIAEGSYIPVSGYKPDFKRELTEDELSELKTELIPILEKIQEEIFVSCDSNVWKHISILNFVNFNEEELSKKIISNLNYGDFLIQVFDLLGWYPNKIKLYMSVDKPQIERGSTLGGFRRKDLIEIRKDVVDFLSYKKIFDKLKSISVEYYLCEKRYAVNGTMCIIKDEDDFNFIIEKSLGNFEKFFEYIGENVNTDNFIKIKKSNFKNIGSFRTDIFYSKKGV